MLAVWLFIGFWALVALGLFYIASRGGIRSATEPIRGPGRGSRAMSNLLLILAYVGCGIVLPFVILHGNETHASAKVAGIKLTGAEKAGREIFGQHCGVCHTLVESNSIGKVGPDLDQLKPSYQLIIRTLHYGCLSNPPSPSSNESCLGQGNMPSNVVQGRQAREVAQFVARVAGTQ
jgi:hypothetical protein